MKKLLVLSLLLAAFVNTNSQTYNSAVVNQSDGNNTTILTNEIDSITYSNLNTQDIWTKDSIYSIPLSSINSTTFEKFELPSVLVKSENIGDWTEMRIATDGSLMMINHAGIGKRGGETPEIPAHERKPRGHAGLATHRIRTVGLRFLFQRV